MSWNVIKQIVRNGIRTEAPLAGADALAAQVPHIHRDSLDFRGQALVHGRFERD